MHAVFFEKQYLKAHIESVHEGNKPFKCSSCDVTFTEKRCMKKHFSKFHEGKKL
jgi:uncharacterized C2H2 Zn-finger protein